MNARFWPVSVYSMGVIFNAFFGSSRPRADIQESRASQRRQFDFALGHNLFSLSRFDKMKLGASSPFIGHYYGFLRMGINSSCFPKYNNVKMTRDGYQNLPRAMFGKSVLIFLH
jgi:hypothetical protein